MNLSRVRLLADNGDHYVLHDGAAEFRVPKSGLSEAMHAKIRGMAKGGAVEGKYPPMPQPKDRRHVEVSVGELELQPTPKHDKAAEYEEETGTAYRPSWHRKPAPPEPSLAERVGSFMQRAASSVRGMAEGGGVEDVPERRDGGPIVFIPAGDGGLRPVPASQVAAAFSQPARAPEPSEAELAAASRAEQQRAFAGNAAKAGVTQTPTPEQAAVRQALQTTAPAGAAALNIESGDFLEGAQQLQQINRDERAKLTTLRPRQESIEPPAPAPAAAPPKPTAPAPSGYPAPDSGVADMTASVNAERAALEAKGNAEADQARSQVKVLGAVQEQLQANALAEKQRREQARSEAQQLGAQRQALTEELKRIDTKVDPGRYWASRTTAQKVLGAIGLALGSIGAGKDGVNRAALLMGQAIDRDIEAQKAEHTLALQKGEQRARQLDSIYAQNRNIYQDDLASLAASKATALELADNQLRQAAATYASPIAKANAAALSAQLQASIAKFKADASAKAEERRHHIALEGIESGKSAVPKAVAKEQIDAESSTQTSLDLIRSLRASLAKTQSAVPGVTAIKQNFGEEAPAIETMAQQLQLQVKNMAQLGAISADDSKRLEKLIGDPQAVWGKGSTEAAKQNRLKALEAELLVSIRNKRKAAAGVPAQ